MNKKIVISSVVDADFAAWTSLWDGYNAFYGRVGLTALPPEVTALTWARFLDPAQPMHALVAKIDGQMIGLAHYLFHLGTAHSWPNCYLSDLYTIEAARGQGVGRKLIEAVYWRALEAGAMRVYWQTHETNTTAMRLYDQVAEKSGFLVYRKLL